MGSCTVFKDHDKVYADVYYLTDPPQCDWVCRRCGATGRETKPSMYRNEYEELIAKYRQKGGV